jgi:hypothetical protein
MKTRLEYVLKAGISVTSGSSFLLAVSVGPTLMPTQYHVQWLPVTFFFSGVKVPRVNFSASIHVGQRLRKPE